MEFVVLRPPRGYFQNDKSFAGSKENPTKILKVKDILYGPFGTRIYYEDHKYPLNGLAWPPAVEAIRPFKRLFMACIRLMASAPLLILVFYLFRKKIWEQAQWFAYKSMKQYLVESERLSISGQEFHRAALKTWGEKAKKTKILGIFLSMWELDTAYRFRIQDGLFNLNKNELKKNPKKELIRIIELMISREVALKEGMRDRWRAFKKVLSMPNFFYRKLFKEFVAFLLEVDLSKIQMDINDIYWTFKISDYEFQGMKVEERMRQIASL